MINQNKIIWFNIYIYFKYPNQNFFYQEQPNENYEVYQEIAFYFLLIILCLLVNYYIMQSLLF